MLTPEQKKKYKKKKKGGGGGSGGVSSSGIGTRGKCITKKTLYKHFPYLHAIFKSIKNKEQRNALIDKITSGQMACIKQVIQTFLQGKVQLSEQDLKKIKRDKKFLYSVISNKTPLNTKKKVLKMKGAGLFLPLLSQLAPALLAPVTEKIIGPVIKEVGKVFR